MNFFEDKDTFIKIGLEEFAGIDFHESILELPENILPQNKSHESVWIEFLDFTETNFPVILNILSTNTHDTSNDTDKNYENKDMCIKIPCWMFTYLKRNSIRKLQNQALIRIIKSPAIDTNFESITNDFKISFKIVDILNCWFKDNVIADIFSKTKGSDVNTDYENICSLIKFVIKMDSLVLKNDSILFIKYKDLEFVLKVIKIVLNEKIETIVNINIDNFELDLVE